MIDLESEAEAVADESNDKVLSAVLDTIVRNILQPSDRMAALERASACEYQRRKVEYLRLKKSIGLLQRTARFNMTRHSYYASTWKHAEQDPTVSALRQEYKRFAPCGGCKWCKTTPHRLWDSI